MNRKRKQRSIASFPLASRNGGFANVGSSPSLIVIYKRYRRRCAHDAMAYALRCDVAEIGEATASLASTALIKEAASMPLVSMPESTRAPLGVRHLCSPENIYFIGDYINGEYSKCYNSGAHLKTKCALRQASRLLIYSLRQLIRININSLAGGRPRRACYMSVLLPLKVKHPMPRIMDGAQ